LRKQYPKAEIRVSVSVTEETVRGLHDRRFDLGLISLPVPEDNLTIIPLFDEELLIVGPATSKSRRGHISAIRPSELARVPFLLYPRGTVLRVLIDRFFKDIGVMPRVVMEAEDTEAIKRLVESGFGYSVLPEHALRRRTTFFHAFRVDGHPVVRGLALAMVRTEYPRKLTVSIAEFLRSMLTP
jgi:DNA-binding transcriptional LysR family regulator